MSAIRYNGSWQPIASMLSKHNGAWVPIFAIYARVEGEWVAIDLNAVAKAPPYNVWKAFADDINGGGISLSSTGKSYIGYATGMDTAVVSIADASIFTWSIIDNAALSAQLNTRILGTENLLKDIHIDNSVLVNLNASFQQLGVDLLNSQGDTNVTFNAMVQKLQDTDSFVNTIDTKVGQILVEGNKVSFDSFNTYQLKVDALDGTLSSVSTRVTNSEAGLVTANTAIQQNADQISLLAGTTSFSDLSTKVTQVSLKVDGLDNSITQESFSANFNEWDNFHALLKGEINVTDLIEKNVDFGFAETKLSADVTDIVATASAKDILVSNLDQKISLAITHKEVLSTVDFASSEIKTELRSETAAANAGLTESLNTLATDQLAEASKTTILEATISDPLTGLAKSHSRITDESSTRSTETSALAIRSTTLEANLLEADGLTPKFSAAVIDNNIAAIGFCTINPTINTTEALCVAASGTWKAAEPFSSSFKKVTVTDNKGNVVNASNTLTAHIDTVGSLEANAVIELDVNGHVVGTRQTNNGTVGTMQIIADKFEVGVLSGAAFSKHFYLDSTTTPPQLVFIGRAEFGGYSVKSESDIRALDGNTVYDEYQYSIDGSFLWHSPMTTGDKFRRERVVTISPSGTTLSPWTAGYLFAGIDGAQGAGTYVAGTATGLWDSVVAHSATPNGAAVLGDVVTIYKVTDQKVATTMTFDGVNWIAYAVRIHGNQLVDGSITSQQVNTVDLLGSTATFSGDISAASATYADPTNTTLMNQNGFVIWHGSSTNANAPTRGNAVWFLDKSGNYKKDVSRRRATTSTFATSFNLTPTPHYVIGGVVELVVAFKLYLDVALHISGSILVNISFRNGATTYSSSTEILPYSGVTYPDGTSRTFANFSFSTFIDTPVLTQFSSQSFVAHIELVDLGTGSFLTSATTKSLSAKFTTLEIA